MGCEEKVEKALIPYFGEKHPEKALKKALPRIQKGGKLFLLHITDEAHTRSIRYTTGQLGDESEMVKTYRETLKKAQKKAGEEFAEDTKKEAAKRGVSIEVIYVEGDPAQEVIKAIEEHSIELVVVEKLREKVPELFFGDEIDYLSDEAPCEVLTIS